ncbi:MULTISPECIES: helix-turn-helix domain-containing protein [unclassified Micromonospora]|uniref:helix-turn-helix domain-containing protein n=1 Tax=unclassified Micromonospora TaxID=2617518 RepID=UPI00103365AD|nr:MULTISPECIES: helix-turn-helix transcriptional regulator [unclassified Micromonospora]QKW13297.1 helix-turn-helix domain-containing protein [Verrucosispora sp. NA02020]TBL37069.1 XRE family transcriptional regulator [Verrucosispora sp. SN26_14.1]
MAQWRVRRRMTQQMLADRLGKSKSWVDKVERGARALDRYPLIEEIARVLRVDPSVLLGRHVGGLSSTVSDRADGLDEVYAVVACHDVFRPSASSRSSAVEEVRRQVTHAWLTYHHAHYPQVLRTLPELLASVQHTHRSDVRAGVELLVQAYRITSLVSVKIGEVALAWLVADRAVTVANLDPLLAATAAIPLGQALRAAGRNQLAVAVTIAAERCLDQGQAGAGDLSVRGTLLLQAAMAAAAASDTSGAVASIEQAAGIANRIRDGGADCHVTFGMTAVEMARMVVATELGDVGDALFRHENILRRGLLRRLPGEYQAAYLLDATRAYLQAGDMRGAGRTLVEAHRTAPAEVRCRPLARTLIAEIARGSPAAADVARLATLVGVTRRTP